MRIGASKILNLKFEICKFEISNLLIRNPKSAFRNWEGYGT